MKFSDETVDFALYIALVQTPIWAEFQYQFQVETPRLVMPMGWLLDSDSFKSECPPSIKPPPSTLTLTLSQQERPREIYPYVQTLHFFQHTYVQIM